MQAWLGYFVTSSVNTFVFSPAGERTFGVLTKLDLMDKGTNAVDVSISCSLFDASQVLIHLIKKSCRGAHSSHGRSGW